MGSSTHSSANPPPDAGQFATTRWSLVMRAGRAESPESQRALATLCQDYWFPLYAYARRKTANVEEAQDLTQSFFVALLEKDYVAQADPERGRFRAFLLTAFKHFLSKEWERERAQKRGGGQAPIALDFESGENRYRLEPAGEFTPDRLYEREWALTLLDRVLQGLREEYHAGNKAALFDRLKGFMTRSADGSLAEAAQDLGISEGAAKVAAHRLRTRYRERLRAEIAQTVADPSDVDAEIRSLFEILGS
jgi:RNA polymerase sigma-70 factor (ECF subfamily)